MARVKCSLHQSVVLQERIYEREQVAQYYPNLLMGHMPHCVPCDTLSPPVAGPVKMRLLQVLAGGIAVCARVVPVALQDWIQDSLYGDVSRQAWETERSYEVCSCYLWGEGDYTKDVTGFAGNTLIYFSRH